MSGVRVSTFVGQVAESSTTLIGGIEPGATNVISANGADGVFIGFGARAVLAGNLIGTNKDGTGGLGNGRAGVLILDSSGNFIGGKEEIDGVEVLFPNIISDNAGDGIQILGNSTNNRVLSNLIGTDVTQGATLGNGRHGVAIIDASGNFIGDGTAGGRNVILNSEGFGVLIAGQEAIENQVLGNNIGVAQDGVTARGNKLAGVMIRDGSFNLIGDTESVNIISGNDGAGVRIEGAGAESNEVVNNVIGTSRDATADLPNAIGVQIIDARGTIVGGETFEDGGNLIDKNGTGIHVFGRRRSAPRSPATSFTRTPGTGY